jgi:hypothetical protein
MKRIAHVGQAVLFHAQFIARLMAHLIGHLMTDLTAHSTQTASPT